MEVAGVIAQGGGGVKQCVRTLVRRKYRLRNGIKRDRLLPLDIFD